MEGVTDGCQRCFKCREGTGCIRAVSFAPTAMPNRYPQAVREVRTEKQWDADMPAYKRIRNNGVQPKRIDDSAYLESHATDQYEIELGLIVPKERKAQVQEGLAISKELQVSRPKGVTTSEN